MACRIVSDRNAAALHIQDGELEFVGTIVVKENSTGSRGLEFSGDLQVGSRSKSADAEVDDVRCYDLAGVWCARVPAIAPYYRSLPNTCRCPGKQVGHTVIERLLMEERRF